MNGDQNCPRSLRASVMNQIPTKPPKEHHTPERATCVEETLFIQLDGLSLSVYVGDPSWIIIPSSPFTIQRLA
jgi:hypothetical protein